MENVMDINVYDKITKGEHICKGDKLYTREEMKKMLKESALAPGEIQTIYTLNSRDAIRELQTKANRDFFECQLGELKLMEDGNVIYEIICRQAKDSYFLKILLWVQCIALVLFTVLFCRTDPQLIKWAILLCVTGLVTYVAASLWVDIREKVWIRIAQGEIETLENSYGGKRNLIIEHRRRMVNSICNTFHMYECMEDFLLAEMLSDLGGVSKAATELSLQTEKTVDYGNCVDDDLK